MADTKLSVTLGLAAAPFQAGLKAATTAAQQFGNSVKSVADKASAAFGDLSKKVASGIKWGTLAAGAAGVATAIKSIHEAANFEKLGAQLSVLLGSYEKGFKRLGDVEAWAGKFDFDLEEAVAAARTLLLLSKDTLSLSEGLETVGNISAGIGRPLEEVASAVGKVYSALQAGAEAKRETKALRDMGIISRELKDRLDSLSAAGIKGAAAWREFSNSIDIKRFAGVLDVKAGTFSGLMAQLKDAFEDLFRYIGEPLIQSLKGAVSVAGQLLGALEPAARRIGEIAAGYVNLAAGIIKTGRFADVMKLVIGAIAEGMKETFAGLSATLGNVFKQIAGIAAQPALWEGMVESFKAASKHMAAAFLGAMARAVDLTRAMLESIGERIRKGPGAWMKRITGEEIEGRIAGYGGGGLKGAASGLRESAAADARSAADAISRIKVFDPKQAKEAWAEGTKDASSELRDRLSQYVAYAYGRGVQIQNAMALPALRGPVGEITAAPVEEEAAPAAAAAGGGAPAAGSARGAGEFFSISGKRIPRKRIDARSRAHRDLWGRAMWTRPAPGATDDGAVEEARAGRGGGKKGDQAVAKIERQVGEIQKTLDAIFQKMPKVAVS